jgi:hypothetical protein
MLEAVFVSSSSFGGFRVAWGEPAMHRGEALQNLRERVFSLGIFPSPEERVTLYEDPSWKILSRKVRRLVEFRGREEIRWWQVLEETSDSSVT